MRSMAVDAAGAALLGTLAERQVAVVVIKGPAVARFYPEGWPRPYADLDIVVEQGDFDRVVTLAKDQGYFNSEQPYHNGNGSTRCVARVRISIRTVVETSMCTTIWHRGSWALA